MLEEILGQDRALEAIRAALRSGRLHHAWIFSGPRGLGKFTAAMALARVLLDPGLDPAAAAESAGPTHRIQRAIDAGTHPDLHVIRKELALYSENRDLREKKLLNIPLDLLRERMIGGRAGDDRIHEAPAYRTAQLGHGKVFIIDEAELLALEGQNALLKTLEEPPSRTYIILITSQPDRLLATIRSRCQHVRFGTLNEASMKEVVRRILAGRQAAGADGDAARAPSSSELSWVLQFAEGSPGVAQLAVEYELYEWHRVLEPMLKELDRGRFAAAMGDTLGRLVEDFAQRWVKAHGEKNTSKDAANKDGVRHVLSLLSSHARRRMAEAAGRGADPSPWLRAVDLMRETERQVESNVNLKLALENLVAQWANQETAVGAG